MKQKEVAIFQRSIVESGDPVEIARKVKLAFKKMPVDMALAYFARLVTAELPHDVKVAVWDAVRYSHIWWAVDEVLKGQVMENPMVQQAFADALPMRKWIVDAKLPGWENIAMTIPVENNIPLLIKARTTNDPQVRVWSWINQITHQHDTDVAYLLQGGGIGFIPGEVESIVNFSDFRGNNILWYLTYRDDQNAHGGFACPCIERELLRLGVDPNYRNSIGLCWNDVRRHVIREEL